MKLKVSHLPPPDGYTKLFDVWIAYDASQHKRPSHWMSNRWPLIDRLHAETGKQQIFKYKNNLWASQELVLDYIRYLKVHKNRPKTIHATTTLEPASSYIELGYIERMDRLIALCDQHKIKTTKWGGL